MNNVLDDGVVTLLVMASLLYAMLKLGPRTLRQRMQGVTSRVLAVVPRSFGLEKLARRLQAAAASSPAGACGGCDNCGAESAPVGSESKTEIAVPIAKIGRRVSP